MSYPAWPRGRPWQPLQFRIECSVDTRRCSLFRGRRGRRFTLEALYIAFRLDLAGGLVKSQIQFSWSGWRPGPRSRSHQTYWYWPRQTLDRGGRRVGPSESGPGPWRRSNHSHCHHDSTRMPPGQRLGLGCRVPEAINRRPAQRRRLGRAGQRSRSARLPATVSWQPALALAA